MIGYYIIKQGGKSTAALLVLLAARASAELDTTNLIKLFKWQRFRFIHTSTCYMMMLFDESTCAVANKTANEEVGQCPERPGCDFLYSLRLSNHGRCWQPMRCMIFYAKTTNYQLPRAKFNNCTKTAVRQTHPEESY